MVRRNDFLIREAERIIDNYVKESRLNAGIRRREYEKEYEKRKAFKRKILFSVIMNFVLGFGVIALLLFILNII